MEASHGPAQICDRSAICIKVHLSHVRYSCSLAQLICVILPTISSVHAWKELHLYRTHCSKTRRLTSSIGASLRNHRFFFVSFFLCVNKLQIVDYGQVGDYLWRKIVLPTREGMLHHQRMRSLRFVPRWQTSLEGRCWAPLRPMKETSCGLSGHSR